MLIAPDIFMIFVRENFVKLKVIVEICTKIVYTNRYNSMRKNKKRNILRKEKNLCEVFLWNG